MLDVECSLKGCAESYVQKVKIQHKSNKKLFSPNNQDVSKSFGIQHFAGPVVYEASQFLSKNRDIIPDDIVAAFSKSQCNFGFVSHLFSSELKILENFQPKGAYFRISPTNNSNLEELSNQEEPASTLTQDFHTRLDNLLRTLVHAKPHFIRCINPFGNMISKGKY